MRVMIFQAANGETIALTPEGVEALERAGVWPRNSGGEKYSRFVAGGVHGEPTLDGADIARLICDRLAAKLGRGPLWWYAGPPGDMFVRTLL